MTREKLPNVADVVHDAECAVRDARDAHIAALTRIQTINRQRWIDAGGCTRCNGTGRMIVASYSDEDVRGPCIGWPVAHVVFGKPETPQAWVSSDGSYGTTKWTCTRALPCTAGDVAPFTDHVDHLPPSERTELEDLEESLSMAEDILAAESVRYTPHIGAHVLVVRGRKVPQGTVGVIAWTGDFVPHGQRHNRWRDTTTEMRVGIRVAGVDALQYTAGHNVLVTAPSRDIDLPSLSGSPKQVAWALRLRLDSLAAGMTDAEAAQYTGVRWWIDRHVAGAKPEADRPVVTPLASPELSPASTPRKLAEIPYGQTGRLF